MNEDIAPLVRKELNEQQLPGPAWVAVVDGKLLVYLESDSDNDLDTMLAASRIERVAELPTTLAPLESLSPAEQSALRKAGRRI